MNNEYPLHCIPMLSLTYLWLLRGLMSLLCWACSAQDAWQTLLAASREAPAIQVTFFGDEFFQQRDMLEG